MSPSTDGLSGETKDLWVFYFTDRPDISDKLAGGLKGWFQIQGSDVFVAISLCCMLQLFEVSVCMYTYNGCR